MKLFNKATIAACLFAITQAVSAAPTSFNITAATLTPDTGYGNDTLWCGEVCPDKLDMRFQSLFTATSFNLEVGESKQIDIAKLTFKEGVIFESETDDLDMTLALNFLAPGADTPMLLAVGHATVGFVKDTIFHPDNVVDYKLTWGAPMEIAFGNGGLYQISLNDIFFTKEDQAKNLVATIKLKSADVPEPGSLALLGLGMLGAGVIRRRRTAK